MGVGVLEGPGRLAGDPDRVLDRELPLAAQPVAEAISPSTKGMVNQSCPAASPES